MSWICLNGTMSTTVQGLLIQTLPPISKPLMRTMIEEIDGRDGDIITKLGYSAYDKEITIGLHGDYDVDEVISFFNSEGEVIFSNEPDKFYRYQILDQIDFEHLLRFKTAAVVFHVQPFKYSAVDDAYWITTDVLKLHTYKSSSNSPRVISNGEYLQITGNSADNTFDIPIDEITLNGDYTLELKMDGKGGEDPSFFTQYDVRIYGTTPTDAESFGGTEYTLDYNDDEITDTKTISNKTFKYVRLTTHPDSDHADIYMRLWDNDAEPEAEIINRGNIYAKPRLTIYGSGNITLSINNNVVMLVALGNDGYITIDAEAMNAYKGNTLKNRSITGDYKDLYFPVGKSLLSWLGNVKEIKVENGARWI